MSVETELKERLSAIAGDGHRAADETEVWPLAVQMMDCLGSTDPELRDDLIYRTLARWSEWYLDTSQLDALLDVALAADHLTLDVGEREGDAVFMRAFSSLAVAIFVGQHRARPYLGAERVHEVNRTMLAYLSRERDARGWVPGKGWADAVSHAADALDGLVQCPELGEADLLETLQAIRETVVRAEAVFPGEEDERLVTAVVSAVRRGVLTRESIAAWILDFAALEAVGDVPRVVLAAGERQALPAQPLLPLAVRGHGRVVRARARRDAAADQREPVQGGLGRGRGRWRGQREWIGRALRRTLIRCA